MSTSEASGNGPAFPFVEYDGDGAPYNTYVGMSLRDYFAAKVMAGIWSSPEHLRALPEDGMPGFIANIAYEQADAMLDARDAK